MRHRNLHHVHATLLKRVPLLYSHFAGVVPAGKHRRPPSPVPVPGLPSPDYAPPPPRRYPDFIEDTSTGKVYITETQKSIARIHEIPDNLLQGLFSQHKVTTAAVEGLALTIKGSDQGSSVDAPHFTRMSPYTVIDQGLTIELHLEKHSSSSPGNVLLSSVAAGGPGVLVTTTVNNSITFSLFDDAGANVTLRTGATCTSVSPRPRLSSLLAGCSSGRRLA